MVREKPVLAIAPRVKEAVPPGVMVGDESLAVTPPGKPESESETESCRLWPQRKRVG